MTCVGSGWVRAHHFYSKRKKDTNGVFSQSVLSLLSTENREPSLVVMDRDPAKIKMRHFYFDLFKPVRNSFVCRGPTRLPIFPFKVSGPNAQGQM